MKETKHRTYNAYYVVNDQEFRWHVEPPSGFNKNRFKPVVKSSSGFVRNQFQKQPNDHDNLESNRTNFQPQIKHSQPIYKAFALHDFHAQSNKELPFHKGDTILVKRRINDDWLEGEHHGLIGIFPINYVELLPYESNDYQQNEGEAIVKYDYIPQKSTELHLQKDERVILLRRLDNNWYEGRVNHIEGILPGDYIEILREPKDYSNNTKIPKSVLKNSTSLQQTSNIVPESSLPTQKCQVIYDYTPQNSDELEIHVGDIINIIEMCDDGWYCGVIEKSNYKNNIKFGTFPGNYVKLLPT